MFQEAVEALRKGERPHAKDILTRLLKTDQNNALYWIWMSAAVETPKERVYCLQTALQMDPENVTAKRGLILLGALPPDETVPPFPVNHPRAWEQQLLRAHEKTVEKKPFLSRPLVRLAGLGTIGLTLCGLVFFMFVLPRLPRTAVIPTYTFGPSPTFTLTPTALNETARPSPTYFGPTPLWAGLVATYTPTPFFMPNVDDPQLKEILSVIRSAYGKEAWDEMLNFIEQGIAVRPDLPDLWFLRGEAYRFQEKYPEALEAYEQALTLNPDFGPAYVGRARVNLALNPRFNPTDDLETAIENSPTFVDSYIVLAAYKTDHDDAKGALKVLKDAEAIFPDSPLIYYEYGRAYLALEDYENALASAQRANELDITLVPVYLILGDAYASLGQTEDAMKALNTYVTYAEENRFTLFLQGKLSYMTGDYETALEKLNESIEIENDPMARMYRGLTYLELGDGPNAVYELRVAIISFPESFDLQIGLTHAYFLNEEYGNSYVQAEQAFALAENDEQRAQVYYWRAKAQDKMGQVAGAKRDWEALLALPANAVSAAWRTEARERLTALTTPSRTPTITQTPSPSRTPTKTPTPKPETKTPTPTPTK